MDLGYGSQRITRLDYHGHIRSNALNYADGQVLTLVNTSDGIDLIQDTVSDGAVSEQEDQTRATATLKISDTDSISVQVLGMGSAILTRTTPTYTMVTTIEKGNFINTTKVYNGNDIIESDDYEANGVKGVLTKQQIEQVIDGQYQAQATRILKIGADTSFNTSVDDAPATVFSTALNGATDDGSTDSTNSTD